jgi:hypothetical protein
MLSSTYHTLTRESPSTSLRFMTTTRLNLVGKTSSSLITLLINQSEQTGLPVIIGMTTFQNKSLTSSLLAIPRALKNFKSMVSDAERTLFPGAILTQLFQLAPAPQNFGATLPPG